MGVNGSHGPKPYRQRRLSTVFLRVPAADWPLVKRGLKPEFRSGTREKSQLWSVRLPTPCIAYTANPRTGAHDAKLMVLEKFWLEPLGAISPESLEREGFKSLAEFRAYWYQRERKRFQPTRQVIAHAVRPWDDATDARAFADLLFGRLYGDWLADYLPEEDE